MAMSEVAADSEGHRVGYALEPKKVESCLRQSFIDYANKHGIDFIQIDPNTPLLQQGPFHCIIHKLHSQQWIKQLHEFSSQNPNTIIIDRPEFVDRIHNRVSMLDSVTHMQFPLENATVGVPKQVLLNESKAFNFNDDKGIEDEMGLKFPIIAKPLVGHNLFLVFDPEGVNALNTPIVLQEFVNHGGVVFKIYVAGHHVNCVKRMSLPDITEEKLKTLKGAMPFSQISNLRNEIGDDGDVDRAEMLPQSLVTELGRALREALGLNLFNVDVIRDSKDRTRYLVIDINYFPGYSKLPSYEPFFSPIFCWMLYALTLCLSELQYKPEEHVTTTIV